MQCFVKMFRSSEQARFHNRTFFSRLRTGANHKTFAGTLSLKMPLHRVLLLVWIHRTRSSEYIYIQFQRSPWMKLPWSLLPYGQSRSNTILIHSLLPPQICCMYTQVPNIYDFFCVSTCNLYYNCSCFPFFVVKKLL